jgi:hypothetical protein
MLRNIFDTVLTTDIYWPKDVGGRSLNATTLDSKPDSAELVNGKFVNVQPDV